MTLLTDARIVTPEGVIDGWLRASGERIAEIGAGTPAAAAGHDPRSPRGPHGPRGPDDRPGSPDRHERRIHDLRGRLVVPGFVDIHVHGGAGGSYPSGDADEIRRARAYHLGQGTTTSIASLVSASPGELVRAVATLAEFCREGLFEGIHLEGPYLARSRCGAHDPAFLREPDPAELAGLIDAGGGYVRMVTVAPELPGAIDLIRDIVAAGAIAAVGHTEATYEQSQTAFDAGASVVTHLFNAMRPLHHREPGPIGAALQDDRVTVELINDGVHVVSPVTRLAFAAAPGRVALITDAMAAAGMGDGDYRLGSLDVRVAGGRALLADGSSIASSTISMADAFRRTVRSPGLPAEAAIGVTDTAAATALTPARVLGLAGRIGSLAPGKRADLVVLSESLDVDAVMCRGVWVHEPR